MWSSKMFVYVFFVSNLVLFVNSFQPQLSRNTFSQSSSSVLYGSHHLGRYGSFVDALDRPKNKPMEKLYNELNLPENTDKNGADLRKNRERNLKTYKENNPYDLVKTPEVPMNMFPETIESIIRTLNLTLQNKERAALTDTERVGLVNWFEFTKLAITEIQGYSEDEKFQKKLLSWTKYHIRKRDLVFIDNKWSWDNTRIRRHGRFRTAIVPREKYIPADVNFD